MRNTPIRRSTKRIPRESEKHRLKRLAEGRKARTPIKPKKRSAKSAERIYGPKEFRAWLHQQPCAVCGYLGVIEQAHAKGDGIARKADWTHSFPACGPRPKPLDGKHWVFVGMTEGCHREMHRTGAKSFEAKHGVTLLDLAAKTQSRWRAHVGESA